jgi:hypothetical protein
MIQEHSAQIRTICGRKLLLIPLILQIIAKKNDSRAFCANPHDLRKKTFINPAYIADHRGKK